MSDQQLNKVKELPLEAVALRPVRMDEKNNRFIHYEAITFPKNPYAGCELYLRRCSAFGHLQRDDGNLMIDVLDEEGDIIAEYDINRRGFEYLRAKLKFRRETD
jgi:hypothetical protein